MMTLFLPLLIAAQSTGAPMAERRPMVASFERIRVDGPFAVRVTTGSGASARVIGDPRALDAATIRVESGMMTISPARGDRGGRPEPGTAGRLTIEVTTPRLSAVTLVGSGSVRVDRMSGIRVDLSLTGAGTIAVDAVAGDQVNATLIGSANLMLAGRSTKARFLVNGPGSVDAGGMVADTLFVRSEGPGAGRYAARYMADITGLGSGTIDVAGNPACRTSGTATIRCGTKDDPAH